MGGGLEPGLTNPLYNEKLSGIEHEEIRSWVYELAERGLITKIRNSGHEQIDDKWFSSRMADVHGTLGCLAVAGAAEMDDLKHLYTGGLNFEKGTDFTDGKPANGNKPVLESSDCLRLKLLDMLGSEGPQTSDTICSNYQSLSPKSNPFYRNERCETSSLSDSLGKPKKENISSEWMSTGLQEVV